jgi:Mn-dependent DtxR family transcriptional regulator
VTHQELANLIGSTRETTTLILSEFRRRGLIDFAGRKIVVIEPEQLSEVEGASYLHRTVHHVD